MSIVVVSYNHKEVIKRLFNNAQEKIKIISPFIKREAVESCFDGIEIKNLEIITKFNREDFINNVSDLSALKRLKEKGANIYTLKKLHTKLYLIDDECAMLGSANFTTGGFKFNHELSLIIHNEKELLGDLNDYYQQMKSKIQESGDYEITLEKIESEIEVVGNIRRDRAKESLGTKVSNNYSFGADIDMDENTDSSDDTSDFIQDIFEEDTKFDESNRNWLKFVGSSEERNDPNEIYEPVIIDGKMLSFSSMTHITNEGENLYLTAVTQDQNGKEACIIFGRAKAHVSDRNNLMTDKEILIKYPWIAKWPHYVEIYDLVSLNTGYKNGIPLTKLLSEIGDKTYPGSKGKTYQQLCRVHLQKAHVSITNNASQYLDKKLAELGEKYGVNKYK